MNSSPWRLEGVDSGDEQYPVESGFAVRHTPPNEQDPRFDHRRSVSSILRYARPLQMNRIPFRTWPVAHKAVPPFCGTPGLVSIGCSVQALPMNTTTHSVPTQPVGSHAFRCLPMNMMHSVASP